MVGIAAGRIVGTMVGLRVGVIKIVVSVILICTIVDIRGSICAGMINMMLCRMAITVCMRSGVRVVMRRIPGVIVHMARVVVVAVVGAATGIGVCILV